MTTPNKYNAVKTTVGGLTFDSKREAARWQDLCLLQKAGEISDLRRQVPFSLDANGQRICRYISDFCYTEYGREVVEDSKGCRTPVYVLKRRLMQVLLGITIRETK